MVISFVRKLFGLDLLVKLRATAPVAFVRNVNGPKPEVNPT